MRDQFFQAHGYVLGRLYPRGVAFQGYNHMDENFVGGNYVACLEARADLIDLLKEDA